MEDRDRPAGLARFAEEASSAARARDAFEELPRRHQRRVIAVCAPAA
jgi:hypothetical protein